MSTKNKKTLAQILLTGECCIPENSNPRVVQDHIARYNFAAKFVKNKRVLDIACGVGYGSNILKKNGANYILGIDINKKALLYAQKNYGDRKIKFTYGDITKINIQQKLDVIVCFETIEHIQSDFLAIKNLYNSLAKGGLLIISSPNRPITSPTTRNIYDRPQNKFHIREYTPSELSSLLLQCGFTDIKIYGQRPRLHFKWNLMNYLYEIVFNPNYRASSDLRQHTVLTPRYFVITARKAN